MIKNKNLQKKKDKHKKTEERIKELKENFHDKFETDEENEKILLYNQFHDVSNRHMQIEICKTHL